jgi:hypothetical protein
VHYYGGYKIWTRESNMHVAMVVTLRLTTDDIHRGLTKRRGRVDITHVSY